MMLAFIIAMITAPIGDVTDSSTCRFPKPVKHAVFKVAAMPAQVRKAIGPMADFGQPYQGEDLIFYDARHHRLPAQMLVYAEAHPEGWLVYSVHGGIVPGCDKRMVTVGGAIQDFSSALNSMP